MGQWLRQSTACTEIVGPAVDNSDGVTPETGLAAGAVDEIGVYKSAATSLTDISGTTTFTHRAGGHYTVTLSTSDTNTLGRLRIFVRDDSVCLPFWKDYMVVPANVYDAIVAGSDYLQTDAVQVSGDGAAADNLELFTEIGNITSLVVDANGRVDVSQIEGADATDQIRDSILDDATRFSGADIAAILLDTGTAIPALIAALNNLSAAQVNAEVDTALGDYDGPTYDELLAFFQLLIRNDVAIVADRAAELAAINADEGSGAGTYDPTTGALQDVADALVMAAVFPAGAIEYTYTVYEPDGVTVIAGVDVWVSTDLAGANIIWRGTTDAFGVARDVLNQLPNLDAGTYYFWCQAAGYTFANPDTEVVS